MRFFVDISSAAGTEQKLELDLHADHTVCRLQQFDHSVPTNFLCVMHSLPLSASTHFSALTLAKYRLDKNVSTGWATLLKVLLRTVLVRWRRSAVGRD